MQNPDRLETALRNDRLIVLAALVGMSLLAWAYMLHEARTFEQRRSVDALGWQCPGPTPRPGPSPPSHRSFLMWAEMMVAMMIPSAAPMILIFARVTRERREQARPFVPASLFLLGYLLVWSAFSLFAALAQWALHGAALLSPTMTSRSPLLRGAARFAPASSNGLHGSARASVIAARHSISSSPSGAKARWERWSWADGTEPIAPLAAGC
jgi:predicted metal-binding membrane protein